MSTQSTKQSGFSAILSIVAVVLVIGVLGFIGWRLYNQPSAKTNNATSNNQTSSKTPVNNPNPTPTTPQPTYLDIKELGVKVTLDSSISDAVYAPYYIPSTDGSTVVGISAQSLIDKDAKHYCGAAQGPLGIIIESTTQPALISGPVPVDNKSVFKFGNNYYWYRRPQNDGCAQDQITSSMVDSKINAFAQAFTTLQQDQ